MIGTTATRIAVAAALAQPPAAATAVADPTAALSFWITWGLVYLGIGAVLLAVATAIAVRERREWIALLRWTATGDCRPGTRDRGGSDSRRAA